MDILSIFRSFQTQEQCLEYLEKIRWHGEPVCPYCGSVSVGRHASGDRANQRWQCRDCTRAFSVTVGTIFHRTHVPLQNWFLVLGLMLNAKKSASSYQIARDLGMRRPTVWSMMHRVRVAMAEDQNQARLLHGLVEADETYIGGKPRRPNRKEDHDSKQNPRGRGTPKAAVLGAVERGGRVVAEPVDNVCGRTIQKFLSRVVDRAGTLLLTDEWIGYHRHGRTMNWASINHKVEYANGLVHTNTIEGFGSLVKRAWYGSHHHYSRAYLPLYISEACYNRRDKEGFMSLVGLMLGVVR